MAHYLNPLQASEQMPIGQKGHHAVEAEQGKISTSRLETGNSRSLAATINALTPYGFIPGGAWSATVGLTLTGGSAVAYYSGNDGFSAAKRAPRFEGLKSYFDFLGASLNTVLAPVGAPRNLMVTDLMSPESRGAYTNQAALRGLGHTHDLSQEPIDATGQLHLTTRASFPEEVTPRKANPGDPAFPAKQRMLPGAEVLGVTSTQTEEAADPAKADAAARVAAVLPHFMHMPEWVADLKQVRVGVRRALAAEGKLDAKTAEDVSFFLSEQSVLRMYGDMTGPGAVSPVVMDAKGNEVGYLVAKLELRNLYAATREALGVKEEVQRFLSVWDGKRQGGSFALSLPTFEFGHVVGEPAAALGGYSNGGFGGDLTGSLTSTRSHDANTISGDIRGIVYWDESVRHVANMRMTVKWVPKSARRADDVTTIARDVRAAVRIPAMESERFHAMLRKAVDPSTPGELPVDGQTDERRYPQASLAAGQGIHFAAVSHLAKGERVVPALLRMIGSTTPFEDVYLQSQLNQVFASEALKSHASELFQPGGSRMAELSGGSMRAGRSSR